MQSHSVKNGGELSRRLCPKCARCPLSSRIAPILTECHVHLSLARQRVGLACILTHAGYNCSVYQGEQRQDVLRVLQLRSLRASAGSTLFYRSALVTSCDQNALFVYPYEALAFSTRRRHLLPQSVDAVVHAS